MDELAARLGGAAAGAALGLDTGQVSDPVRGPGGYLVLRLRRRGPEVVPPFQEVEDRVRAAYRRDRHEQRLAAYLEALRADAEVRILDPELAAE